MSNTTKTIRQENMAPVPLPTENDSPAQIADKVRQASALAADIETSQRAAEAEKTNPILGIGIDIAGTMLGIGPATQLAGAGVSVLEDNIDGKKPAVMRPARHIDHDIKESTGKTPGLYSGGYERMEAHVGDYGGTAKTGRAAFTGLSITERAGIAASSLRKPDDVGGLVKTGKENLDGLDAKKGAAEISANVQQLKQMTATLRFANQAALDAAPGAMAANYAARGLALQQAPGFGMTQSMNAREIVADVKRYEQGGVMSTPKFNVPGLELDLMNGPKPPSIQTTERG